jgi:disulfide bond formation protein DsbB
MTRKQLGLLAAAGSLALLLGAYGFQYLGGLLPCTLCWWQRYPHMIAVGIGALVLIWSPRVVMALGALAALTTAAIAGFHVGVEQGWWEGLATCTADTLQGVAVSDLLNPDVDVAAPVRCDAIAWSMAGISMAGWNMVASVLLAGLWIKAALTADQRG